MSEDLQSGTSAPWLDESIDQEARPGAPLAVATKERPKMPAAPEAPASEGALERLAKAAAAAPLPTGKSAVLRSILRSVRDSIDGAIRLLDDAPAENGLSAEAAPVVQPTLMHASAVHPAPAQPDDRVVEGVFDGEQMVGGDGKGYAVPPNYASKSKLVEGDLLKLTIGARGNFIYKQIGPIDRQRLVGALAFEQGTAQHVVLAAGRSWRVLKASVSYFKGETADEAVILVPKNAPSKWAALENIIKRKL